MKIKLLGVIALMALLVASNGVSASEATGPTESIGVQGAWTIEVYNPDGTLDERVQFHNAFTGAAVLADLLSLADSMTGWEISVGENICDSGSGRCAFDATSQRDQVTDELVVEGSFSPEFDGNVTSVIANIFSPSVGNRTFSIKNFVAEGLEPVAIGTGQTVQVEVRYSFGSLP